MSNNYLSQVYVTQLLSFANHDTILQQRLAIGQMQLKAAYEMKPNIFPNKSQQMNVCVFYLVSCSSHCPRRGWGGARLPSPRTSGSLALTVSTEALALTEKSDLWSKLLLAAFLSPITAVVTFLLGSLLSSGSDPPAPWQPRRPALRRTGAGAAGAAGPGDSSGGPRWPGASLDGGLTCPETIREKSVRPQSP